jgi:L-arabinokinase
VFVGRAPGRLDVMGGIADYSGALVLQLPLGRRTTVSVQRQSPRRCEVRSHRGDARVEFAIDIDDLTSGSLRDPHALASWFAAREPDRWAAYVVGVVQYCLERARDLASGMRVSVESTVPEGKGVSSSAALEVATMMATCAAFGIVMDPRDVAIACQWVENHVVGAPCGIMDQMTSACGQQDRLLRLRCQPGTIEGYSEIPRGYRFFGIDSGLRHAVTGADYGTVRTAAFMGYRMIADAAGFGAKRDGVRVTIEDPRWNGYLANIAPNEFEDRYRDLLPERMRGAEFLERFGGTTDTVTRVESERVYPVRNATAHPVREQARVARFAELLGVLSSDSALATELGQLMYASHASYSACGLGSDGTDHLVDLVASAGGDSGLFGAKITGGGSGGTVAILGVESAEPVVREIAARYATETGRPGEVFSESGPGAAQLGVVTR